MKHLFIFLVASSLSCLATEEPAKVKPETPYSISTCVVSENPLGVMGPPFIIDHNGTEVRFCCQECVKDFNKDPEKYLKKLHGSPQ
ncbi:MAG: YHS domain-containing protein [Verrucomicrobia bacterium]|nr:MAG: YHS domain-containing protein [Verrucomicrobiota bacterium]